MLLTPGRAAAQLHITTNTLKDWAEGGKIRFVRLPSKHRRYYQEDIERFIREKEEKETPAEKGPPAGPVNRETLIYARVSSKKQEGDLLHQIEYIKATYPNREVITDIGSGINFKRKGLRTLLERIFNGTVEKVVVAEKDRLSRFGFDLFEWIFKRFGATIHVLSDKKKFDPEVELATDLFSIITVFSARYYGKRKYIHKIDSFVPDGDSENPV